MIVTLGNEQIDVSNIKNVTLQQVTQEELEKFEINKNGRELFPNTVFDLSFVDRLEKIIKEYKSEIVTRLPIPQLNKSDFDENINEKEIKKWVVINYGEEHSFQVENFDMPGELFLNWKFQIKNYSKDRNKTICRKISISDLMLVFEKLLSIKKSEAEKKYGVLNMIWDIFCIFKAPILLDDSPSLNHTYEEIQTDLLPIYAEYKEGIRKVQNRKREKLIFINEHKSDYLLCIAMNDFTQRKYMEGFSGFDIFEKEKELESILSNQM